MNTYTPFHGQHGSALIISLLILLVMTLLGVTSMQGATLEEKMAGNMRDRNLAFQAAESALRSGEIYLATASMLNDFNCSNGLYKFEDQNCDGVRDTNRIWDTVDWSSNQVMAYTGSLASLGSNPGFIIEEIPPTVLVPGEAIETEYFRITARGTGGTTDAVVRVQSTYLK